MDRLAVQRDCFAVDLEARNLLEEVLEHRVIFEPEGFRIVYQGICGYGDDRGLGRHHRTFEQFVVLGEPDDIQVGAAEGGGEVYVEILGGIAEAGYFDYVVAGTDAHLEPARIVRNTACYARAVLFGEDLDRRLDDGKRRVGFEHGAGHLDGGLGACGLLEQGKKYRNNEPETDFSHICKIS